MNGKWLMILMMILALCSSFDVDVDTCIGRVCKRLGEKRCKTLKEECWKDDTCCKEGLVCFNISKTERQCNLNNYMKNCTTDLDCFGNSNGGGACVNSTCVGISIPGDQCGSENDVCINSGMCLNSTCKGRTIGSECDHDHHCNINGYCNGGKCVTRVVLNKTCVSDVQCKNGAQCFQNKCTRYFSIKENRTCSTAFSSCEVGLFCDEHMECSKIIPIGKTCKDDRTCDAGEGCLCIPGTQLKVCYPENTPYYDGTCDNTTNTLFSCMIKNNCFINNATIEIINRVSNTSCARTKCTELWLDHQICKCQRDRKYGIECSYYEICGRPVKDYMIVLVIIGGFLFISLMVLFAVQCRSTKKDEEEHLIQN